jgi:two-component system response regulator AtoC
MRVLIVDDEKNIRESLGKYLSLEKIDSQGAVDGEAALELLAKESFDAVILDLKLPGMSGQAVLEWMQKRGVSAPAIMISAHGEIPDAVRALKSGAKDYLVKPFDPAELSIRLRSLIENRRRENALEAAVRTALPAGESMFLGQSPLVKKLTGQIDRIAGADVTVLITGESGSGKEVAAREIHRRGPNRDEPFVAVNIGGIHEGLMESELFGHEKGAFTGAVSRKQGLFELAGRGCIFLDEIGEMPMPLQVKLLRVLQDRKVRRLGGLSDIPINARIISANNQNLETLIREGRFREDLYYRLNVFRVSLPPLRDRREDIPLLAEHLVARHAGRGRPALSAEALEKLAAYSFPGNVRELENILERALIYRDGQVIRAADIDLHEQGGPQARQTAADKSAQAEDAAEGSAATLDAIERRAISAVLDRCGGNRTKAAELLGVSRRTILNKIKQYRLE